MKYLTSAKQLALLLASALLIYAGQSGLAMADTPQVLPAPPPPAALYRLDIRTPKAIFAKGFKVNSASNETQTIGLLEYLNGRAANLAPLYRSQWHILFDDRKTLNDALAVIAAGELPPAEFWVYAIQPNSNAYSVDWALTEYWLRHKHLKSERISSIERAQDQWTASGVWAIEGDIGIADVIGYERLTFSAARLKYEWKAGLDNPHFKKQEVAASGRENPLNNESATQTPEQHLASFVYRPGINATALKRGTMQKIVHWSMQCAGMPPDGSTLENYSSADFSSCTYESKWVTPYLRAATSTENQLAFQTSAGLRCLTPRGALGKAYAEFAECNADAQRFEYDEFDRLTTRWQSNHWCLASSPRVTDEIRLNDQRKTKMDKWDYLRFEPCMLNSTNQKWLIQNGKIYSRGGHLPLQEWNDYAMISSKLSGRSVTLLKNKSSADFFESPSPARSLQVELGMGWEWKNKLYYSLTNPDALITPWSRHYGDRSMYDYKRQTISALALPGVAPWWLNISPPRYCITSRQNASSLYEWDWAGWEKCWDDKGRSPETQRWEFQSSLRAAADPSKVVWRDRAGHPLWVMARNHSAGSYFTSKNFAFDYTQSSVRQFSIRPDAIRLGARYAPDADADTKASSMPSPTRPKGTR